MINFKINNKIKRRETMSKRTIVTMPGDGIGKTVLEEAVKVLDAVGFEAEYVQPILVGNSGVKREILFHRELWIY